MGKSISQERSKELLLDGKLRRCDGVDNLVYRQSEMPTKEDNNGWEHVIRHNDRYREHKFVDKASDGVIHVSQFRHGGKVSTEFRNGCNYLLHNHSSVRNQKFENGQIYMAGSRFDDLGDIKMYVPDNNNKGENTDRTRTYSKLLLEQLGEQMDSINIIQQCWREDVKRNKLCREFCLSLLL